MDDRPSLPTGQLRCRVWRRRRLIETFDHSNLVVSPARFLLAQMLGGAVTGNSIASIGFGSNGSAPVMGNTALSSDAYVKAVDATTFPAANQVAFALSLGEFEANGQLVAEFGLLTASGLLFARLVREAPLIKDLSMTLDALWTITF